MANIHETILEVEKLNPELARQLPCMSCHASPSLTVFSP